MGTYNLWWWTAMRAFTDRVPGLGPCAVRWLAGLLVQGGAASVRSYIFAHPPQEVGDGSVPGLGPGNVLVPHGSEISYVFGNVTRAAVGEYALSTLMASYWVAFGVSGDPNHFGAPHWPLMFNSTGHERRSRSVPGAWSEFSNVVMRFDVEMEGGV